MVEQFPSFTHASPVIIEYLESKISFFKIKMPRLTSEAFFCIFIELFLDEFFRNRLLVTVYS